MPIVVTTAANSMIGFSDGITMYHQVCSSLALVSLK